MNWLYNPKTFKHREIEGELTDIELEKIQAKGYIFFREERELIHRMKYDQKEYDKKYQPQLNHQLSLKDELAELDINCLYEVKNAEEINDIYFEEFKNNSKQHGGRRLGAGRKTGTSVPLSQDTKDKIANKLKGNSNAKKHKVEEKDN